MGYERGPDSVRRVWHYTGSETVSGGGDDYRVWEASGVIFGRTVYRLHADRDEAIRLWKIALGETLAARERHRRSNG